MAEHANEQRDAGREAAPESGTEDRPEASGAEGKAGQAQDELDALNAKCGELNEKYLRLYADFENYKRQVSRERQDLLKFGSERLLLELLTVVDTLEMGLQHAEEGEAAGGLKKGIEMTLKEFHRVLEKFGVSRIEAAGTPFDPVYHEAMSQVISDEVAEGTVLDEFRRGYTYHEKLLRPSLVSVSKRSEAT